MPRPMLPNRPQGRARLLTVAAVAAIAVTGAAAIGVNLGILNASDSELGKLTPASATVTTAPATTVPAPTTIAVAGTQQFAVDVAGTATVTGAPGSVRLDGVVAAEGWRWELGQSAGDALKVTFTNGSRTLVFAAQAAADGAISAGVTEPVARPTASTGRAGTSSAPTGSSGGAVTATTAPPVTLRPPTTAPHHDDDDDDDDEQYEGGEDDD